MLIAVLLLLCHAGRCFFVSLLPNVRSGHGSMAATPMAKSDVWTATPTVQMNAFGVWMEGGKSFSFGNSYFGQVIAQKSAVVATHVRFDSAPSQPENIWETGGQGCFHVLFADEVVSICYLSLCCLLRSLVAVR